jgi:hypothetical protein
MTVKMFDAAFPPKVAPAGYSVAAGYIGGDTPHVWTAAEWARFPKLHKLPIFTRSDPGKANAANDAFTALRQLYNIGAPRGIAVALDLEEAVDAGYVDAFQRAMNWAYYFVWCYGSASTVFRNPPANGYWVADYKAGRAPYMYNHANVRATQYTDGTAYDSSLVAPWQYAYRLWK